MLSKGSLIALQRAGSHPKQRRPCLNMSSEAAQPRHPSIRRRDVAFPSPPTPNTMWLGVQLDPRQGDNPDEILQRKGGDHHSPGTEGQTSITQTVPAGSLCTPERVCIPSRPRQRRKDAWKLRTDRHEHRVSARTEMNTEFHRAANTTPRNPHLAKTQNNTSVSK